MPALRMLQRNQAHRFSQRSKTTLPNPHGPTLWQVEERRGKNPSLRPTLIHEHHILRLREAQNLTRDLLDDVGVRNIRAQKRHVALELGAHGLEALHLKLKSALTLEQSVARLEAVAAFQGVMGKVGRQTKAEKQHQRLPWPRSPIM